MKRKIPGEVVLLLTAIIWGYGFVAQANSLDQLTAFQVVFLRFIISSGLLILIFHRRLRHIRKTTWKKGAILGVFFFLGFIHQTMGMMTTTASKSAFITGTNVVIVPIIAFFIFRRRLSKQEVIGAVMALAGLAVLTLEIQGGVNVGDLLILACAAAFAFQIFFTTVFMKDESAIEITIVQILACTALATVGALLEGAPLPQPNSASMMPILYLAIFSTTITTLTQAYGQKTTSETRSAIFLSTEALWGTLFSFLFLGEEMTIRIIVGGLIIFTAILVSEIKLHARVIPETAGALEEIRK